MAQIDVPLSDPKAAIEACGLWQTTARAWL